MAGSDTSTIGEILKNNYADKIQSLVPVENRLQKLVPFDGTPSRNGFQYVQPVIVSNAQWITTSNTGESATLLAASTPITKDALVNGMPATMRLSVSYPLISRSDGKNSFGKAQDIVLKNGIVSFHNRKEQLYLYGQDTLGTTSSGVNTSSTSETVTFTPASFSAGIWAANQNAPVNFYDDDAALVSSGADAIFTVSVVDVTTASAPTVLFTGTSTGCTALHTALNGDGACTIHHHGSASIPATDSTTTELYGIKKQLTNTGSLFNIDAAAVSLWRGNTYDSGAQRLTVGKLMSATAKAVSNGLGSSAWVLVSPSSFANISSDLAGLRRFSDDDSATRLGTTTMTIYGPNGELSVMPHRFLKDGDAFILPMNEADNAELDTAVEKDTENRNYRISRPGSSDITFKLNGMTQNMVFNSPTTNDVESRLFSDDTIFISVPSQAVYIYNITNS